MNSAIMSGQMSEETINLLKPRPTPCVLALVTINVAVFVFTHYGSPDQGSGVRSVFALWPTSNERVFVEIWRLITFQFLHLNPLHIFLNMFVVVYGGTVLEQRFGWKKFLGFYLSSAAVSAFFYELLVLGFDARGLRCSGASGGVYAIMAGVLVVHPRIRLCMGSRGLPFWWVLIAVVLIDNHQLRSLRDGGEVIHLLALAVGAGFAFCFDRGGRSPRKGGRPLLTKPDHSQPH